MRISDCAELTGTTVRTIRYYHQIGLLPVPERHGGRRDYELEHIARLLRIRWLADAGLPLESVADVLAEEQAQGPERVLGDLRSTATGIGERIAELQDQHRRVTALIEMAEGGRELSALPPGWALFYERMAGSVTDPAALAVLRREQRLAEMFAQRGLLPAESEELISRLTEDDMTVIVDFYTRYAHLGDHEPDTAQVEADAITADLLRWCEANPGLVRDSVLMLPAWFRGPRAVTLMTSFAALLATHRRQARLLRRLVPALMELALRDPHEAPADHADDRPADTHGDDTPHTAGDQR